MNNYEEVALAMYQEHMAQARQHEDHREKLTNLILVLAGALLAFASSQSPWRMSHLYLTLPVVGLGVFGAFASIKHFERNRMHTRIAKAYRTALARSSGLPISRLHRSARRVHRRRFPWSFTWRLYRMWIAIPVCVALVGLLLSVVIIADECSMRASRRTGNVPVVRPQTKQRK